MASITEVQSLLRFLKEAKVPIPLAMSKVPELKKENLTNPESLSKAPLPKLLAIFQDEKQAKQILSAAKRVSKKRTSSSTSVNVASKKAKYTPSGAGIQLSSPDFEESLALPSFDASNFEDVEAEINKTVLYTNRAPLVVAFVVQLLKYVRPIAGHVSHKLKTAVTGRAMLNPNFIYQTMPSQPLSSRLSLAQAVMSMGATSKARNLGIQSGPAAEDEGWGTGQPELKVMGRSVKIMRRWTYHNQRNTDSKNEQSTEQQEEEIDKEEEPSSTLDHVTEPNIDIASQETIKADPSSSPLPSPSNNPPTNPQHPSATSTDEPPVLALDLEALKKTSSPLPTDTSPFYPPHTARNYLLKSFATPPSSTKTPPTKPSKPATSAHDRDEKENNLARLLYALDLLFTSWIDVIGPQELDRRAFGWYARVRPQVEDG
ncbi:MAG: hypothetical protein Q9223_001309 [Gallowayella weberi]